MVPFAYHRMIIITTSLFQENSKDRDDDDEEGGRGGSTMDPPSSPRPRRANVMSVAKWWARPKSRPKDTWPLFQASDDSPRERSDISGQWLQRNDFFFLLFFLITVDVYMHILDYSVSLTFSQFPLESWSFLSDISLNFNVLLFSVFRIMAGSYLKIRQFLYYFIISRFESWLAALLRRRTAEGATCFAVDFRRESITSNRVIR